MGASPLSAYEQQRKRTIEENDALLQGLGLSPLITKKKAGRRARARPKPPSLPTREGSARLADQPTRSYEEPLLPHEKRPKSSSSASPPAEQDPSIALPAPAPQQPPAPTAAVEEAAAHAASRLHCAAAPPFELRINDRRDEARRRRHPWALLLCLSAARTRDPAHAQATP